MFFFFKQKTAYEMRISDWSSDVCSSDLPDHAVLRRAIRRTADRADETHDRRRIDDHAAGRLHGRQFMFHAVENAAQVDIDDTLPLVDLAIRRQRWPRSEETRLNSSH